jgi:hypothetical protein
LAERGGPVAPLASAHLADSELLAHLERGVDAVFASMIGACAQLVRLEGCSPREVRGSDGDLALECDAPLAPSLRVERDAVVEFRGALDGHVALRADAACAATIARGLLMASEEEALGREEIDDALKECANMLTGWLKSHALDPFGAVSMGVPSLVRAARDAQSLPVGALVYRASGGAFALELWRRSADAPTV